MTDESRDHSTRLDVLEAHCAHQDKLINELSDVIAAQWRKIDALERQITRLREAFQTMGEPRGHAPEPPPPHY